MLGFTKISWNRFLLGWLIPFLVLSATILLPSLIAPKETGIIYPYLIGVYLILAIAVTILFKTRLKDWFYRNEDEIGWCIQCILNFAIPPAIILSLIILDICREVNFNMSFIAAGAIIYYALRLQSHLYSRNQIAKVILPLGIAIATSVIFFFDYHHWWVIIIGLIAIVANLILYTKAWFWAKDKSSSTKIDVLSHKKAVFVHDIESAFDNFRNYVNDNIDLNQKIKEISFPEPRLDSSERPYIDYIKAVSELPKNSAKFASLEQLILSISPSFSYESWSNHVHFDTQPYHDLAVASGDILKSSQDVVNDFIHEHSVESIHSLTNHIANNLMHTLNSSLFKVQIHEHMGHSLKDGLAYIAKKLGQDSALGAYDYIKENLPPEQIENIISSFDGVKESMENYLNGLVPMPDDVDVSLDMDSHFPMITSVMEGIKLLDKLGQGDVDMGSAFSKSVTKIAGRGGGATVGSIIGTAICPGIGSIIGGMIGSWIGGSIANDINMQKYNELKEQFEKEKEELDRLTTIAKSVIEAKQKSATNELCLASCNVNEDFKLVSHSSPIETMPIYNLELAICIIVRSYMLQLLIKEDNVENRICIVSDIPSFQECFADPYRCVINMVKSQALKDIDRYLTLNNLIYGIINEIELRQSQLMVAQTLWLNHVRVKYIECMNDLLQQTEYIYEDVNTTIETQREIVSTQAKVCEGIAEQAKDEAKTL